MKKSLTIILFLSLTYSFSQSVDDANLIEKIKLKSVHFLLEKGEIDNIDNYKSKVSIIEILETKVIGYNKIGIYRLFSHKSPSNTYILLKKNSAIQFIDLKDFEKSFKSILKFLNSTKFDDEKKIFYLEKIIEVYHNNNYSEKIKL